MRVNDAVIERLEKVIDRLSDNSLKMGQMLAVHDEKLEKQDRIDAVLFEKVESVHREVNRKAEEIKKGCERDIRKVDERLRTIEKKMWTIAGAIAIISFVVSPMGQRVMGTILTPTPETSIIETNK
jgi:prefoldin subunit 5